MVLFFFIFFFAIQKLKFYLKPRSGDIQLDNNKTLDYTMTDITSGLVQTFTQYATKPVPSRVSDKFVNFYMTSRMAEVCNGVIIMLTELFSSF